jgi:hypothetical protein
LWPQTALARLNRLRWRGTAIAPLSTVFLTLTITKMKSKIIKFRCSQSEKERIEGMAREAGTTTSEYCRQQSIAGRILANRKLSPNEVSYFQELKEHNNGLSRLANLILNRPPGLTHDIEEYLAKSRELYNRVF